jgi:hypothetical protein
MQANVRTLDGLLETAQLQSLLLAWQACKQHVLLAMRILHMASEASSAAKCKLKC